MSEYDLVCGICRDEKERAYAPTKREMYTVALCVPCRAAFRGRAYMDPRQGMWIDRGTLDEVISLLDRGSSDPKVERRLNAVLEMLRHLLRSRE